MKNSRGRSGMRRVCIAARVVRTLALGGTFFALGCASRFPPVVSRFDVPEKEFALPPKVLLQQAKDAVVAPPLSLGIEREEQGSFITGYQRFPGEWHIGRRWQERTNYRITVIPDFDEPMSRARLQVAEQTEQRAASSQDWKPANELNRPERAAALLREIEKRVGATKPAATTQPVARE